MASESMCNTVPLPWSPDSSLATAVWCQPEKAPIWRVLDDPETQESIKSSIPAASEEDENEK